MIYLAKGGKTTGPFATEEINALRASGELAAYEWIWNVERAAWEPIGAAPPAPPIGLQTPAVAAPVAQSVRPAPEPAAAKAIRLFNVPDELSSALEAICHDHRNVTSGTIKRAGESGCDFFADSPDAVPLFMKDMPAKLNLVNPETGASMSVRVEVTQATRDFGRWKYRLSWDTCPEIILHGVKGAGVFS